MMIVTHSDSQKTDAISKLALGDQKYIWVCISPHRIWRLCYRGIESSQVGIFFHTLLDTHLIYPLVVLKDKR